MAALAWHITMRLMDERVLVTGPSERRLLARSIWGRAGSGELLVFHAAGDHIHLVTALERRLAGRFAHDVEVSLHWQLGLPVPFQPARLRPIRSQDHLVRSFGYVIRQAVHHELPCDPHMEATSLPDLLGARVLGSRHQRTVRRLLPGLDRTRLLDLVHAGFPDLAPAALDDQTPHADRAVEELNDATAAAAGLPTDELLDRSNMRCTIHAAATAALPGTPAPTLAAALKTSPRTIRRFRHRGADPTLVTAIERQLQLRAWHPSVTGAD